MNKKVLEVTSVRILVKIEKTGHEELGLRVVVVAAISRNLDFRNGLVVNRKLLEVSASEKPLVLLLIKIFIRRRRR